MVTAIAPSAADLFQQGEALFATGRVDDAVTVMRSCLALDPTYQNASISLCHMLQASGRNREAIDAWTTNMKAFPHTVAAAVINLVHCRTAYARQILNAPQTT